MARKPKQPKPPMAPAETPPENAAPLPAPDHDDGLTLKNRVETAAEEVAETVRTRTGFDLRRINGWKVARNIALFVVGLAVLLVAALTALNTPPGRRLLVEFATGIKLNSGLQIEIGEIDGSLYGEMTLHDVKIKDLKGVFIQSPAIHLDWRPFGYLGKHVDIRDFSTAKIEMLRRPVLNPGDTPEDNGPLLPDLDIDINRLKVDAFVLDAPVLGQDSKEAHTIALNGQAHLRHKRLNIDAAAVSEKADKARVLIDAAPDKNQLDISAGLDAPADGLAAKLLGFDKAFIARVDGKGTWKQWNGRAIADLGPDNLLDLGVTAQSGTFHITGATHPDLILTGDTAALFKPAVMIDLTSKMKDRVFDNVLALYTDAVRIDAKGTLDLGKNHFRKLELHARLLKSDVLGKDFTASDLRADLLIDGDFDTPRIDYDLAAKRFDLGGIKLDGFTAKGKSRVTDGGVIVPVNAQLTSLTGIAPQVDPLLTHLKLDGEVRLKDGKLTSDMIRISSDRLKATGTLTGNLKDNLFLARVKASLNNYAVGGVGTVNVSTVADVKLNHGKVSVAGTANAQTTRLEDGLKSFLGGNAKLSGAYAYSEQGVVSLRNLSGKSPDFTLTSASGSLAPNGAISLNAKAVSAQYGALDAVASGTLDHPNAVIHAANPGLGVKMVDVTAKLSSTPQGFALLADGGSAYGPFSADALVMTEGKPLRIDIHKATFAGIDASGLLTQNEAGLFTGTLAISGSGLKGTALLSVQNGDQAVAVNATGNSVNVPGDMKIYVGRTIVTASIVLHDQMSLNVDVQMADMRYQDFVLATARARVQMTGEHGTIQAVATGKKDVPFNLAVNGTIAPDTYTFAAQGAANDIPFRLNHPAVIRKSGDDWVLQPVKVVMDQGSIDLSGRFGENLKAQARLNDLDLSLANMVRKDLGLTGTASGAIDFTQTGNGFPTARANLKISRFSRASAAVVSTPVDIALDARLDPDRSPANNYVHAIIRQGGSVVGRAQVALTPANGGDWIADINSAGVSGGVRYNGPAGMPFSLAGLPRQQLSGAVALAADISGQLNDPQLNGVVKATSLTYDNESIGTRITNIALDGRFTNDRLELTSFSGRAGDGTVKGNGWLSLAAAQKFPMLIHVEMNNARLARSDSINSTVSGTIDVTNSEADGGLIKGDLRLPQLKYVIIRQAAAEVAVLDGVRRKGEDTTTESAIALPAFWRLNISARADNQIFVSGMGLESEWSARLRITGTTKDPRIVGDMKVVRGNYTFAGRSFDIDSGTITFDGGPVTDPEISLTASADVQDVTGIIKVSGSAERPDIAFSSTPSLPQDEILSRMLFGESVANISPTEALQLASAVNGLNGGTDYLNPLGALRAATGIDRLRVVGADTSTGRGTSVAAGKYLTNNVYVEIVTDAKGFTATQLEVALSRSLSILSTTGNAGTGASVRYSKDY